MQTFNPVLQEAIKLHQEGKFPEAETAYKAILKKEENVDLSIYTNLVDVLNQQGKVGESIELLESTLKIHPKAPQLRFSLGQIYLSLNQIDTVQGIVNSLINDFPTMSEAHYLLGNVYLQKNQAEEAFSCFEKTIEHNPQFAEAYYNLGILFYHKKDNEKAELNWKKALEIKPALLPALLNLANLQMEQTKYEEAILSLEQVLKYDPEHFSAIKMAGMCYHSVGNIDKALSYYLKIDNEEKPSEEVLTLIANANRDLNRFLEAERYYRLVLKLNPDNAIAKENIERYIGGKIEAWHFNMLGDLRRNEAYEQSINRLIKKGETVLDIGTGSGLLSMMCARAGAQKVYSCETVEVLANAAKQVIADNKLTDKIEVFHCKSNSMQIGEEIPEKVDVLVSEILDVGALGEGVLPSIRHAKANLLKENGKILPAAVTIKAMLIQSEHLKAISPIEDISGFDLRSFGKFQVENQYRMEILKNIPHTVLSDEFDALTVDFYNLPSAASPKEPNIHPVEVNIKTSGRIDAVVFWFDLHFDSDLSLSSGPNGEMIHWGQAILTLPESKQVKTGNKINLNAEQSEMKLHFNYT